MANPKSHSDGEHSNNMSMLWISGVVIIILTSLLVFLRPFKSKVKQGQPAFVSHREAGDKAIPAISLTADASNAEDESTDHIHQTFDVHSNQTNDLTSRIGLNSDFPDYTLIRAAPGTFDESEFLSRSNKFKFPKYSAPKTALVGIKDVTDYREDICRHLEPDEKRDFGIDDFERNFVSADIEVESFYSIFDKRNVFQKNSFKYLVGHGSDIELLISEFYGTSFLQDEIKQTTNYVAADQEWKRKLLENGFLSLHDFKLDKNEFLSYKKQYLTRLTVADLKTMCLERGFRPAHRKGELIEQLLPLECEIELPPAVERNDKFDQMLQVFYEMYIEDVKHSINSWHPFIIREVWVAVSTDVGCIEVEEMAKQILAAPYWSDRLVHTTI